MPRSTGVHRRVFDGLFGQALHPSGAFLEALRSAGFDRDRSTTHYPVATWRACLEVARRFVHPEVPIEDGLRALGRAFVEGFAATIVGRVFALSAPVLGAERCLIRLPVYLTSAREDVRLELAAVAARHWQATYHDDTPMPDFIAGVLEGILALTRVTAHVEVTHRGALHSTLTIRW